jgi:hypothetical protein
MKGRMSRLLLALVLAGCGRIVPGAVVRPDPVVTQSSSGGGSTTGGGFKPVYDEKGCVNGSAGQMDCRRGK